jgi:hypothetical protein
MDTQKQDTPCHIVMFYFLISKSGKKKVNPQATSNPLTVLCFKDLIQQTIQE